MKVLECSSRGDKRFSAFFARITLYGRTNSIENFYQLSKRFNNSIIPKTWRDAKGRKPDYFVFNNRRYDLKYLPCFYKTMWVIYLNEHPELVEYAKQFDDFHDMFKSKKSMVCQADVIRQYIKQGRQSIIDECMEFIKLVDS